MKEPGQNCRYVDDLVNEMRKYIPDEAVPEITQMSNIIKDRFRLMRKWGKSKDQKSRCCGRCDGFIDICFADMTCETHGDTGCEICYGPIK